MKTLQQRALERHRRNERNRKDPRFQQVLGRLVFEKLLTGNNIRATRAHPTVEDALWAGEKVEPRILELLPAIILRRPKLFTQAKPLPEDLEQVVRELRRGAPTTPFRGVPAEKYADWAERLGKHAKGLAIPKTHRFTESDLDALRELKTRWNVDETAAIRRALSLALQS